MDLASLNSHLKAVTCFEKFISGWKELSLLCVQVEVSSHAAWLAGLGNVQGYIDIHAYSQYWMYPYAWTYSVTPDDALLVSPTSTVHYKFMLKGKRV